MGRICSWDGGDRKCVQSLGEELVFDFNSRKTDSECLNGGQPYGLLPVITLHAFCNLIMTRLSKCEILKCAVCCDYESFLHFLLKSVHSEVSIG